MKSRAARALFLGFILLYTAALTWPGLTLANHARPFVFGLPFIFFWVSLWVALGLFVFWAADRIESRRRRGD